MYILLVVLLAILVIMQVFQPFFLLRLKIRENSMKTLAQEFALNFTSTAIGFRDYYSQLFLHFHPDWKVNVIDGKLNGHTIHIYDNLFPGPDVLALSANRNRRYSVIQIDGEIIKGQYRSFSLGDSYLTSINSLRQTLTRIQQND